MTQRPREIDEVWLIRVQNYNTKDFKTKDQEKHPLNELPAMLWWQSKFPGAGSGAK